MDRLANYISDVDTVRGMGSGSVNPLQATSMVGKGFNADDEFRVARLIKIRPSDDRRTSDWRGMNDHRGNRRANEEGQTQQDNRRGNRDGSDVHSHKGNHQDGGKTSGDRRQGN